VVENLTEGMFPLAAWVQDKIRTGKYKPDQHVPWRDTGRSLSVRDTGAVMFFEQLLKPE